MFDFQIHSPVQALKLPLYTQKKVNVFVKRDDLIHPFISGNKWRKLKYTLEKAYESHKKHLVTFGGTYSNHLLATACAAAQFGFKSTGIVRGEKVHNEMLMLCTLFGMELVFVDRESYRDKKTLFEEYFGESIDAYFIDEGGASKEAIKGCAELVKELPQTYDHIFCACGTGTTVAGIIKGIHDNQLETSIHALPVFKNGSFIKEEILKYVTLPPYFHMHLDYHFGGYAKTKPELIQFIRSFSAQTGILIDPVYTGKLFYALNHLVQNDYFPTHSQILAIHTGGIFGLLGMADKFQK